MLTASLLIRRNHSFSRWAKGFTNHNGLIIIVAISALISIFSLVFSDNYSSTWKPLFNYIGYNGWAWSYAVHFSFIINILTVLLLVTYTGGSINSPFQPLYFLIPSLSLFLHESNQMIILYASIIALSFILQVYVYEPINLSDSDTRRHKLAYTMVSVLCLIVTCFIGIITRPQSP